jgi:hypothetical protein
MQRFPDFPIFVKPEEIGLINPIQVLMMQGQQNQPPGPASPEQQTAGQAGQMAQPAQGAQLTTTAQNPMDINAEPVSQGQPAYGEAL